MPTIEQNDQKRLRFTILTEEAKSYRKGPFTIYLPITVNGIQKELLLKREGYLNHRNTEAGNAAGIKEDARALDVYWDTFQAEMYETKRHLLKQIRLKQLYPCGKSSPVKTNGTGCVSKSSRSTTTC